MNRLRVTRLLWTIAAGIATLAILGSSTRAQSATTWLAVPDRVNEHVSLASEGQFVAITWAASHASGGTDVYAATSRNGGETFSEPVRVNGADVRADVGGEQPPQIVLIPKPGSAPSIAVIWTAKGDAGTRLMTARSNDSGRTFGRAAAVSGSEAAGNRGWEAVAADTRGRPLALWLDHRETARQPSSGAAHHHSDGLSGSAAAAAPTASAPAADGVARAQLSQLFVGSLDGSVPAQSIARGVCYCCRTALASGSDGAIYAAWRHVYAGNRRDIAFTASRDGGKTFSSPVRVSEDDWQIDGCPENGPAMAIDRQQRVHLVWPTLVRVRGESTLGLFHAVTADGRTFSRRSTLPTSGAAYHPRLTAAPDGSLLVAWDEAADGTRRIKLARGTPDRQGMVSFRPLTLPVAAEARYPAMTVTPTHAVLAWASRQGSGARIAVVRVPLS